jgi:hypothetical protein
MNLPVRQAGSNLLVELIPLSCAEFTCAEFTSVFQYQQDLGFNTPNALRRNIKSVFLFDTSMALPRSSSLLNNLL